MLVQPLGAAPVEQLQSMPHPTDSPPVPQAPQQLSEAAHAPETPQQPEETALERRFVALAKVVMMAGRFLPTRASARLFATPSPLQPLEAAPAQQSRQRPSEATLTWWHVRQGSPQHPPTATWRGVSWPRLSHRLREAAPAAQRAQSGHSDFGS